MANMTPIEEMLAQFAELSKPDKKNGWLFRGNELSRFDAVVAKIKHLLETGKGFAEAQEALFFFETGRGSCPCSLKSKAVEKYPKERDALLKRIDDFLNGMVASVAAHKKFSVLNEWYFGKEAVALIKVVREEVKKEAEEAKSAAGQGKEVMLEPEYSTLEPDEES